MVKSKRSEVMKEGKPREKKPSSPVKKNTSARLKLMKINVDNFLKLQEYKERHRLRSLNKAVGSLLEFYARCREEQRRSRLPSDRLPVNSEGPEKEE